MHHLQMGFRKGNGKRIRGQRRQTGGVTVPLKSVAGNRYLLFVVRDGTLK